MTLTDKEMIYCYLDGHYSVVYDSIGCRVVDLETNEQYTSHRYNALLINSFGIFLTDENSSSSDIWIEWVQDKVKITQNEIYEFLNKEFKYKPNPHTMRRGKKGLQGKVLKEFESKYDNTVILHMYDKWRSQYIVTNFIR